MITQGRFWLALSLALVLAFATGCWPDREKITETPTVTPTGACCQTLTGSCSVLTQDQCEALQTPHLYLGTTPAARPILAAARL